MSYSPDSGKHAPRRRRALGGALPRRAADVGVPAAHAQKAIRRT